MIETTATSAATTAAATSATPTAQRSLADSFDNFLTLLTAQLQNQDPLSPMDTQAFTQQIVEFTSLEQAIKTNSNLDRLIDLTNAGERDGSAAWLGTVIEARTDRLAVAGSSAVSIPLRLEADAAKVDLRVLAEDGSTLFKSSFAAAAGSRSVSWNGRGPDGAWVAEGSYRIVVDATDTAGKKVVATPLIRGLVDAVELGGDDPVLRVGEVRVPMASVSVVHRPATPADPSATTNGGN